MVVDKNGRTPIESLKYQIGEPPPTNVPLILGLRKTVYYLVVTWVFCHDFVFSLGECLEVKLMEAGLGFRATLFRV